jgi:hypothetical protein
MELLTLTLAERQHISILQEFYSCNSRKYLPAPDADLLDDVVYDNSLFIVVNRLEEIVAAAGVFPLCYAKSADEISILKVYELAGMALNPRVGGLNPFTIQDILISVRVLSLAAAQEKLLCLVSSVVNLNQRSSDSLMKMGFRREQSPPRWLRLLQQSWIVDDSVEVADFIFQPAAISACVKCLREALAMPLHRVNRENGEVEEYRITLGVLPDLNILMKHDFSSLMIQWETNLPTIRMSKRSPHIDF